MGDVGGGQGEGDRNGEGGEENRRIIHMYIYIYTCILQFVDARDSMYMICI